MPWNRKTTRKDRKKTSRAIRKSWRNLHRVLQRWERYGSKILYLYDPVDTPPPAVP